MNFSDQLKQYRKQFSLNQAELAQFLEVSPRSVWKWENEEFPHILTQEGVIHRLNQEYSPYATATKLSMMEKSNTYSFVKAGLINISTAINDCDFAKSKWLDCEWGDCISHLNNAIISIRYAIDKIYLHQESQHSGHNMFTPSVKITGDCELHDQYKLRGYQP